MRFLARIPLQIVGLVALCAVAGAYGYLVSRQLKTEHRVTVVEHKITTISTIVLGKPGKTGKKGKPGLAIRGPRGPRGFTVTGPRGPRGKQGPPGPTRTVVVTRTLVGPEHTTTIVQVKTVHVTTTRRITTTPAPAATNTHRRCPKPNPKC